MKLDRRSFLDELKTAPIVNSHAHFLPDGEQQALTLEGVLRNSYVAWCGVPVPASVSGEEIGEWLGAVRTRSYFLWLEKALMELYRIDAPLDARTWETYDAAIRRAHGRAGWHMHTLKETCRYEAVALDAYWSPGSDNGHPGFFRPAYRVNSLFYGYNRRARDHNGGNIQVMRGSGVRDIDGYLSLISGVMGEAKEAGCVSLKCALAYDRTLSFGESSAARAQRAMREDPEEADVLAFQDVVMDRVCAAAAELNLPLQVHTGLGLMRGSGAMRLQPLIARHPKTTFLLMHGGYPWTADVAGLAQAYPNVWADLCWLPLISTAAADRLLHELIDVCGADRVVWGCDTWTAEESYGARLAFLHVLSRALAGRVEDGLMRENDARRWAQGVLHDNAARVFGR